MTEFEITCGIACRGEFLTKFGRRRMIECDGCPKGDYTKPNSHLFHWPVRHTNNKQADEHNRQQLEMGMPGRWGWDKTEEHLGSEWEATIGMSGL